MKGMKFGRLTVIRRAGFQNRGACWLCRCTCGRIKKIHGDHLRRGYTRSCGCLAKERASQRAKRQFTKHGHVSRNIASPEYYSWKAMIQRCTNSSSPNFERYGGRGITVCKRWRKFKNFLTDMGKRPAGKTLDRKNVNGNYKPSNCKWATKSEQQFNRRKRNEFCSGSHRRR